MSRPSVEDDKIHFVECLERLGGSAGNVTLRTQLNWEDDRYWRTHSLLLDEGRIVRGRGKGGSVTLVKREQGPPVSPPASAGSPEPSTVGQVDREYDLYEPMKIAIGSGWIKERGFDEAVVEVTGLPGRRNTGGTWTRPDLAVLAVKAYPYLPGRIFDIITFEVKNPTPLMC